jgi:hypothetical protein
MTGARSPGPAIPTGPAQGEPPAKRRGGERDQRRPDAVTTLTRTRVRDHPGVRCFDHRRFGWCAQRTLNNHRKRYYHWHNA